jgi:hypothetical protein
VAYIYLADQSGNRIIDQNGNYIIVGATGFVEVVYIRSALTRTFTNTSSFTQTAAHTSRFTKTRSFTGQLGQEAA